MFIRKNGVGRREREKFKNGIEHIPLNVALVGEEVVGGCVEENHQSARGIGLDRLDAAGQKTHTSKARLRIEFESHCEGLDALLGD